MVFTPVLSTVSSSSAPRLKDQPNVLDVPFNGKRLITRGILEALDADNTAEEIKYHLISIVNSEESFIQVSGKRVQSFSQEEVNQQKVLFVHRTRDSKDSSSSIQSSVETDSASPSSSRTNRKNPVSTKVQASFQVNSRTMSSEQNTRRFEDVDREDDSELEQKFLPLSSSSFRNSWNNDKNNNVKIILSVSDGASLDFLEAVIEVALFRVKLIPVHETGISLIKFSHQLILQDNLTFETNDPPENMINGSATSAEALIKYEVVKFPDEGVLQKKLPDKWTNVTSYFTQRQINRGKIRYLHYSNRDHRNNHQRGIHSRSRDAIRLRASYRNIITRDFDFVITFVPPELRCIANHDLVFEEDNEEDNNSSSESDATPIPTPSHSLDNDSSIDFNNRRVVNSSKKHVGEAIITSDHLTYDTIPSPCDPSRIIYTLLSLPSLGLIFLTNSSTSNSHDINKSVNSSRHHQNRHQERKQLTIGSFFTQEMISQRRILYKRKSSSFSSKKGSVKEDSFDFEVTTELGQTNVIVSSFR
jgi:hypothetical protein